MPEPYEPSLSIVAFSSSSYAAAAALTARMSIAKSTVTQFKQSPNKPCLKLPQFLEIAVIFTAISRPQGTEYDTVEVPIHSCVHGVTISQLKICKVPDVRRMRFFRLMIYSHEIPGSCSDLVL